MDELEKFRLMAARSVGSRIGLQAPDAEERELTLFDKVPIPWWPDGERACPSEIARSAIFSVREHGADREYMDKAVIASYPTVLLTYSGPRLDQVDMDVVFQLMHLRRGLQYGRVVVFNGAEFLKAIGRDVGGNDYAWLNQTIDRLRSAHLVIKVKGYGELRGTFVGDALHHVTNNFAVEVNRATVLLFAKGMTRISIDTRRALRGSIARWLHVYVCSHEATSAKPSFMGMERLRDLCGSLSQLRDFRRLLHRACEQLIQAGVLTQWWIDDNDVFYFVRPYPALPTA